MFQGFTGWHALIILVVILLLFGAPKLPALARSLGQSMKILKSEVRSDKADDAEGESADGTAAKGAAANGTAANTSDEQPKTGSADSGKSA